MSNTHGLRALNILNAVFTTSELDDRTEAITNMLGAQVHATLAVAEQLRIANLIALAGLPTFTGSVSDYADELRGEALATLARYESSPPDYEAIVVDPDIAASLGLAVEE